MKQPPYVEQSAWDQLGVEHFRYSSPVSMRHIKEYLAGSDNWNDLYCNEDVAKRSSHGGIIAPPLFFLVAGRDIRPVSSLMEDGQYNNVMVPGIHGASVLADWNMEIGEPVRPGDILKIAEKITSIQEKEGRQGPLIFVTKETVYQNQREEFIGRDVQTIVFR